ncbi:MAG: TlpA disulfide reductase family protein [Saprospiraceae bacterium]
MNSNLLRNVIIVAIAAAAFFAWRQYRQPNFTPGDPIPDFTAALADGRQMRLSDLHGKYVLLQFWGSWCGPCRAENPELVKLYQRYHDRGLEIFSIGIEEDSASWQRAIRQDGMIWPYHSMEGQDFNGGIARQFNIHSIPATYLLNPQGVIMGVNHDMDRMENVLESLLPK